MPTLEDLGLQWTDSAPAETEEKPTKLEDLGLKWSDSGPAESPTKLEFSPPEDLSGFSPEQLNALNERKRMALGLEPPAQGPGDMMAGIDLPRYEGFATLPGVKPPAAVEALGGAYNTAAGLVSGLTSPASIGSVAAAAANPVLGKVIAGIWAAKMGLDLKGQVQEGIKAFEEDQPLSQKVEKTLNPLATLALGGFAGRAALKGTGALPGKIRGKLAELTKEKGVADALQNVEAKTLSGDVPQQPGEGQQGVPAQEGGGGVPPGRQGEGTGQAGDVVLEPKAPTGKGIAGSVRSPEGKWTRATSDETGAINLAPLKTLIQSAEPALKATWESLKEISDESLSMAKTTDQRRALLNWSGKLQRSTGESMDAQKSIEKAVPDKVRRDGITNWIQAKGDLGVLAQRAAATKDAKLKAGYEAALTLTPEELQIANDVKTTYDTLGQRGQAHDVLGTFKDGYVTQIWDLGKSKGGSGSRTLRDRFKFSKARTFDSFFDGEQAGFTPKTKDISKLLPVYLNEMNHVIAARQLVAEASKGVGSDGRPMVTTRGQGMPVATERFAVVNPNTGRTIGIHDTQADAQAALKPGQTIVPRTDQATLINPKSFKGDTSDYKTLPNQPALHDWKWMSTDSAGNPVMLKGDLALHPEFYHQLKRVLGKSIIREWYTTRTSAAAQIPKKIAHGLDWFNSETKRTMLGLLAPFHQVQEGTHAIGHRVSPFWKIPKIDLVHDLGQLDAAKHGLMLLPDRVSEAQFMEGFKTSGLVSKIPILGPIADAYSNYLFKQYIPGLKYKTYEAILERNMKVYEKDLASGKYKPEDVKILSAEQANAAYGHLNYTDLSRSPTFQHFLQLTLLAPDFLEARGRFAIQAAKGATGAKVGREQLLALGFLALSQAATAWTSAKLSGGEWDPEHPFEFRIGSRKYTMRSVPEDIDALRSHTRAFINSRLSPVIGRGTAQYMSGKDYAGRNISAADTTKQILTSPVPLTVRALPGVKEFIGQDRPGDLKAWENLAGAVGLKISRYNPRNKISEIHNKWMKDNKDPLIKADYEQNQTAVFPVSRYKALDSALADRDEKAAAKAIAELRAISKDGNIVKRMDPFTQNGPKPLFHESPLIESRFLKSLSPEEKELYKQAKAERKAQWALFLKVWRQRPPRGTTPQESSK